MNSFFRSIRVFAFAVLSFALLAASPTFAQTFRGTILGAVSDSSGAAVPGATVTIKNLDTGLTRTVSTSDDGSYCRTRIAHRQLQRDGGEGRLQEQRGQRRQSGSFQRAPH